MYTLTKRCVYDSTCPCSSGELDVNDMVQIDNILPLKFTSKKIMAPNNYLITCSDLKEFSCLLEIKEDHLGIFRIKTLLNTKNSHLYLIDNDILLTIDCKNSKFIWNHII